MIRRRAIFGAIRANALTVIVGLWSKVLAELLYGGASPVIGAISRRRHE